MIGHNASTFDIPVLLRSAPSTFSARLKSLGVIFADSLVLIKHLRTCSINTALLSNLPNKLGTLYAGLFKQQFDAHDALEDVKALSKILFHSSLKVTVQQILEHSGSTTVEDAIKDVQFLDRRDAIAQTYKQMSYPDGRNVLSENMKMKPAENGISFEALQNIYAKFGNDGLFAVVALPKSSNKSQPRITRYRRIQAQILLKPPLIRSR